MTNVLYSFRRCPYAIRARLAIAYSQQSVWLREVELQEKPPEMLQLSAKGTVPILQLSSGEVLDESLEIMVWALSKNDPDKWLANNIQIMLALIDENDFEFKLWLDKYKYADRFPVHDEAYYREQCEYFLSKLERYLFNNRYLFSQKISLADIAILPFIRQFAAVDMAWFKQSHYPNLQRWLADLTSTALFTSVMKKYPSWLTTQEQHKFP